jgi:hypothetical protein
MGASRSLRALAARGPGMAVGLARASAPLLHPTRGAASALLGATPGEAA